jgi:hypothetical protein
LHGGAGLGVLAVVYVVGMAPEGTNTNGETKCLRSAIDCVDCCGLSCIVYYNACIIIRIHVFLCFYLRNFN